MWILIIISTIYGGQSVDTKEFYSLKACNEVLEFIKANSRSGSYVGGTCIKNSTWIE